jgi:magnesium-transporting ATPase (P-type)
MMAVYILVRQGFVFINNDEGMLDHASNHYALARNTNLNEDLGKITYVFSDKTGTLTSNEMQLRRVAVKGATFGNANFRCVRVCVRVRVRVRARVPVCARVRVHTRFHLACIGGLGLRVYGHPGFNCLLRAQLLVLDFGLGSEQQSHSFIHEVHQQRTRCKGEFVCCLLCLYVAPHVDLLHGSHIFLPSCW